MTISIKILQAEQVTERYVNWFSNPNVVKYSDNQYKSFSYDGQCQYVRECFADDNVNLYGIFDGNYHIGNVTLSGLCSPHLSAEVSYVIGETEYWNKGIASYAIAEMIKISKLQFNLNKLFAGVPEPNVASQNVLLKNGFILEGKRSKHIIYNQEFMNLLEFGLLI